jgi:hypothetical protein
VEGPLEGNGTWGWWLGWVPSVIWSSLYRKASLGRIPAVLSLPFSLTAGLTKPSHLDWRRPLVSQTAYASRLVFADSHAPTIVTPNAPPRSTTRAMAVGRFAPDNVCRYSWATSLTGEPGFGLIAGNPPGFGNGAVHGQHAVLERVIEFTQ